jgi:hypothetical protein
MYGLNEIVAMNMFQADCHKERVNSDHLSCYNICAATWPRDYLDNTPRQITHGEWEARQQKEREHESASNE